jgi:CcmD family protein
MSGVIHGGWGYVIAAYGVVWLGLIAYGASLVSRRRAAARAAPPEHDNET